VEIERAIEAICKQHKIRKGMGANSRGYRSNM
jgi:hypothetical protein